MIWAIRSHHRTWLLRVALTTPDDNQGSRSCCTRIRIRSAVTKRTESSLDTADRQLMRAVYDLCLLKHRLRFALLHATTTLTEPTDSGHILGSWSYCSHLATVSSVYPRYSTGIPRSQACTVLAKPVAIDLFSTDAAMEIRLQQGRHNFQL